MTNTQEAPKPLNLLKAFYYFNALLIISIAAQTVASIGEFDKLTSNGVQQVQEVQYQDEEVAPMIPPVTVATADIAFGIELVGGEGNFKFSNVAVTERDSYGNPTQIRLDVTEPYALSIYLDGVFLKDATRVIVEAGVVEVDAFCSRIASTAASTNIVVTYVKGE